MCDTPSIKKVNGAYDSVNLDALESTKTIHTFLFLFGPNDYRSIRNQFITTNFGIATNLLQVY